VRSRPVSITVFALYLLIVFGISAVGSLYGAIRGLPPYSSTEWLVLLLPKLAALFAGIAFWKMLRLGAWLWAISVLLGWGLAFGMRTGFFPSFNAALVVAVVILIVSVWVISSNWSKLMSWNAARLFERVSNA
jgi:hypothetical protein